jgi:hypothetical protein
MSRQFRVPKPLRDWRVTVPIAMLLGALLAALLTYNGDFGGSSQGAGNKPAPAAAPQSPPPAPVDPEQEDLNKLRETPGTGFNCPENDSAKKLNQLRLCPDYTVTVTFNPSNPTAHPTVTMPKTYDGLTPIVASVEPIHYCGNDHVEGVPITCKDYWRLRWTVDAKFTPLGFNEQATKVIREDGSYWTGPMGMTWPTGDMLVFSMSTQSIEIYAGERQPKTIPSPLSPDRDNQKYDTPSTPAPDEHVLTV